MQAKVKEVPVVDEESMPISRGASPLPSPNFGPSTTRRGEHYSYSTAPVDDLDSYPGMAGDTKGSRPGSALSVPSNGGPTGRRGSGPSSTDPR
jgi:hypothetical protein